MRRHLVVPSSPASRCHEQHVAAERGPEDTEGQLRLVFGQMQQRDAVEAVPESKFLGFKPSNGSGRLPNTTRDYETLAAVDALVRIPLCACWRREQPCIPKGSEGLDSLVAELAQYQPTLPVGALSPRCQP